MECYWLGGLVRSSLQTVKAHKCMQVDFEVALSKSRGVGNHGGKHSGKRSKEKLNELHVGAQDGCWRDSGLKIHHLSHETPQKHIAFRDNIGTVKS